MRQGAVAAGPSPPSVLLAQGHVRAAQVQVALGEGDLEAPLLEEGVDAHVEVVERVGPHVAVGDVDAQVEVEGALAEGLEELERQLELLTSILTRGGALPRFER